MTLEKRLVFPECGNVGCTHQERSTPRPHEPDGRTRPSLPEISDEISDEISEGRDSYGRATAAEFFLQ